MEFTCQDHFARHKDEQHHFGLLHAVDQACTADAIRVRTAQACEDRQLDVGVMLAMTPACTAGAAYMHHKTLKCSMCDNDESCHILN